ncbi:TIGR02444 family protein [Elongatibacter sediminis]|uniref:TIGR02444 family protein n=1 Tax=Elongatibacter sediminis TaxID=3119006 RepID=A0AAW9RQE8_9GAMM
MNTENDGKSSGLAAAHRADKRDQGFWSFSLKTYAVEGVPAACLELQDRHGADVNVVLFAFWVATVSGELDRETLRQALDKPGVWSREVVHPLRAARRWMKREGCGSQGMEPDACGALRERIKKLELEAERLQQHMLEALAPPPSGAPGPVAAGNNLRRYFEVAGLKCDEPAIAALKRIARAALPRARAEDLRAFARTIRS